jgi:hypothetical protein
MFLARLAFSNLFLFSESHVPGTGPPSFRRRFYSEEVQVHTLLVRKVYKGVRTSQISKYTDGRQGDGVPKFAFASLHDIDKR